MWTGQGRRERERGIERERRVRREEERSRLDLSVKCLWPLASPLPAHQQPISFFSAGAARVSYRWKLTTCPTIFYLPYIQTPSELHGFERDAITSIL